jgi:hypothetical protein
VPTLPAVIVDLQNPRIRRDLPLIGVEATPARIGGSRACVARGEALVSVAAAPADLAQMTGQGTATRLL